MRNMIKKGMNVVCLLVVFCGLFLLTGCGKEEEKTISFEAQYIQTDGLIEDGEYPVVKKIKSKEALDEYYKENMNLYNFSNNTANSDISFITAINKYDDSYFEDSFLLIVVVEELSSTTFHEVKEVTEKGKVLIERNVLGDGSTNGAHWHILIEMDKKYADTKFTASFEEVAITNE